MPQATHPTVRTMRMLAGLAVGAVALVVAFLDSCQRRKMASAVTIPYGMADVSPYAVAACQDAVRRGMKRPDSTEFPAQAARVHCTADGCMIDSYASTANDRGVMVEVAYHCRIRPTARNRWTVTYVRLQDQG